MQNYTSTLNMLPERVENTAKTATFLSVFFSQNRILTPVFDLDGVAINAKHRQITLPDGSLDLQKYRENSTASMIAKDQELPILATMQTLSQFNVGFHIATARVMCKHTQRWLQQRGVKPNFVFSRQGDSDTRRDFELKRHALQTNFTQALLNHMVLIDDNQANCEMARQIGMRSIQVAFDGH